MPIERRRQIEDHGFFRDKRLVLRRSLAAALIPIKMTERKGINLHRRKDVQHLPLKGEGEPTVILSEAKKHLPLDYFYNQLQSFDMDHYNKNASESEELCYFQGKFTPEDDEMNPNYKASSEFKLKPTHLRATEDEINPDLEASNEYKSAPAPLSVSEMLNLLPPGDSDLEIILHQLINRNQVHPHRFQSVKTTF
ncbi:hypothetical protein TNCV_3262401 [Trichonephila clavipes]|nr:hypothetical protein TNCV_3262401 [Trichonephila clavipes]